MKFLSDLIIRSKKEKKTKFLTIKHSSVVQVAHLLLLMKYVTSTLFQQSSEIIKTLFHRGLKVS